MKGRVIKSTGSWYQVEAKDGIIHACRLRGKFKEKGIKTTNPLAVGDWVTFELEDHEAHTGIINHIEPRSNYIIRKSPHNTRHGHIIAANIDQAALIATLAFPITSLGFIDRFLVTAETFRIPAIVVINKADLLDEEMQGYYLAIKETYEKVGYTCLLVSAFDGQGLQVFKDMLLKKTTLVSGHSGVGKSTLINKIFPEAGLKTSEVSTFANKGVHTTTFAEMFKLSDDSYIIDTPGIKELGLLEVGNEELSHYFPEMRDLIGKCRFHNCTHTHEPGCAIEEAFSKGQIAASRYKNYLSMLDDEDNRR